jgi:hypothetical protein
VERTLEVRRNVEKSLFGVKPVYMRVNLQSPLPVWSSPSLCTSCVIPSATYGQRREDHRCGVPINSANSGHSKDDFIVPKLVYIFVSFLHAVTTELDVASSVCLCLARTDAMELGATS